jgi:8-amino-7-oxononanoate synthase
VSDLEDKLRVKLEAWSGQHLARKLREVESAQGGSIILEGRTLINFGSNDYLGMAARPELKRAAIEATERYGTGSGASRLICGSIAPHQELERALAAWKGTECALVFNSGYAAALGTICGLVEGGDIVIIDKLVHASIVDAARLSGATLRVYKHNDVETLRGMLEWSQQERGEGDVLVITESVFSMDGDVAPLSQIVALKEEYEAWLMVDEAHACGMFGKKRSGRIEQEELQGRVEIQMGTLGKAVGSSGGFIAGSSTLIEYLVNQARSFIFSTAAPPATSAAARAGVELIQSGAGEELNNALWRNVEIFCHEMGVAKVPSPIIPVPIGSEEQAIKVAGGLKEAGFFVPAIRYPTVARGKARLRVSLSATHEADQIMQLTRVLKGNKKGLA